MLNQSAIDDNDDVLLTGHGITITNADFYTVASPGGRWFTYPILGFAMQDFQLRFDPEGASILMASPAVCQRISFVEQDDHITDYDRQQFLKTRFMFLVFDDVAPGQKGG